MEGRRATAGLATLWALKGPMWAAVTVWLHNRAVQAVSKGIYWWGQLLGDVTRARGEFLGRADARPNELIQEEE